VFFGARIYGWMNECVYVGLNRKDVAATSTANALLIKKTIIIFEARK